MKRYEYRAVYFQHNDSFLTDDDVADLTREGGWGWRVVSVLGPERQVEIDQYRMMSYHNLIQVLLEREVEE